MLNLDLNQVTKTYSLSRWYFYGLLCYAVKQVRKEAVSVGPFLAPFIKMACIYFVLDLPEDQPSLAAALVKCLPITSLMIFVGAQGTRGNAYNQRILAGLALCCVGDAILIWQGKDITVFLLGMVFFSLAQVAYLSAFGFQIVGAKELLMSCSLCVIGNAILIPYIPSLLTAPIVVYSLLLTAVLWRALARFTLQGDIPWRKIYAATGAGLFVVSDFILGLNKFCFDMPYQRQMIMFTYYAAQMCYALSVINSRLMYEPSTSTRADWKVSPTFPRSRSLTNFPSSPVSQPSPSSNSSRLPAPFTCSPQES